MRGCVGREAEVEGGPLPERLALEDVAPTQRARADEAGVPVAYLQHGGEGEGVAVIVPAVRDLARGGDGLTRDRDEVGRADGALYVGGVGGLLDAGVEGELGVGAGAAPRERRDPA